MEVFGAVSGAIGILAVVVDLTQSFMGYINDFRDEEKEQAKLVKEVAALSVFLPMVRKCIEDTAVQSDVTPEYRAAMDLLGAQDGPLFQCGLSLDAINKKLESAKSSKAFGLQKLKWPFRLSNINTDLKRIERFNAIASAIITTGFSSELKRQLASVEAKVDHIQKDLTGLLSQLSDEDRRSLANSLLSTISSTPPTVTPTAGTGQMFLESSQFKDWKDGSNSLLWCPGNAGSGKTTLMTMVIRHLQDLCLHNHARKTVHFYFNYRSSSSVTVSGLYAYLLKGVVHTRALSSTTNKLDSHRRNNSTPSDGEILAMLKEEITTYSSVYFVFDALDEAPDSYTIHITQHNRNVHSLIANSSTHGLYK
ncbi:hypothetical protein B0H13DRAFT_2387046 [Mycena leptocephala]|nr:hypothetical protein B0H13DRAFT_2387046 [Mycena leptocephala]